MKRLFKVSYLFYMILVLSIGIMIFAMLSFKQNDRTISNSQISYINEWKVTFSDGSSRRVMLPNSVSTDAGDKIILSKNLDTSFAGTTISFRTRNQSVVVRLDGKKVYEFGTKQSRRFGRSPGSLWHYVTIPSGFEQGSLEIELQSPFRNLGGSVSGVISGAKSACILHFMQDGWIWLVCGFALLLFGVLFMIYHFAMGHLKLKNTGMFHLGVSSVLLAVHIIISTGMMQVFYSNADVYYIVMYMSLYLCLIPFLLFLADTAFETYKKSLHFGAGLFLSSFVAALILHMYSIVDFCQYVVVFRGLCILLILYLLLLTVYMMYDRKEIHLLVFLLLVLEAAAMVSDALSKPYQDRNKSLFLLLAMMMVLGLVNISKVVKFYRIDLDNRMAENDERTRKLADEHEKLTKEIEELRVSRDHAVSYSDSKSLFLSSVSKKLIVPISNMLGVAELILRDEINDNVRENMLAIQSAGATALTLTNNLVDYSKYETNTLELKNVAYPVGKLLYDMNESVSVALIEKNVDFIVDFSPNLPRELFGDEIRIRQILSTILANAVRYTEDGTIRFRVDAEIGKADEILLNVMISDTGAGISEENLQDIFDMFLLYKTDAAVAGTGLGLAVCKKLLDLMNATVEVESKLGEGTTFRLQIPQKIINGMPLVEVAKRDFKTLVYETNLLQKMMLKKVFLDLNLDAEFASNDEDFCSRLDSGVYYTVLICQSQYEKHQEYLEQPLNAPIRKVVMADIANTIQSYENADFLQRPIHCMNLYDAISGNDIVEPIVVDVDNHFVVPQAKILIVDDNPANLKIATGMMEAYKVNIQTAISGTACLEMLMTTVDYDMVFLDYSMTGMSGVETLHNLREYNDKYYKTLPVIAMTVHMINGAKELFLEEGFDDYIPKPLEQGRIAAILEKFLPEDKMIRNDTVIEEEAEENVEVFYEEERTQERLEKYSTAK